MKMMCRVLFMRSTLCSPIYAYFLVFNVNCVLFSSCSLRILPVQTPIVLPFAVMLALLLDGH